MQNGRRLIWWLLSICTLLLISFAMYCKKLPEKKEEPNLDKQLSMLVGYKMWNELTIPDYPYKVNVDDVIEGIRAAATGKGLPADMNEENLWQKINELQYELFEQKSIKNLRNADQFLSKIAEKQEVKMLIPGKLYYEVLQDGSGSSIEAHSSALFHYKITTLEETVVTDTQEVVSLANAIPGFAKGVECMKAGEKRKLYIHPDLAYRKIGVYVPPQMLLIIEVEAIT